MSTTDLVQQTVSIGTAIGWLSGALSLLFGLYVALLRNTYVRDQKVAEDKMNVSQKSTEEKIKAAEERAARAESASQAFSVKSQELVTKFASESLTIVSKHMDENRAISQKQHAQELAASQMNGEIALIKQASSGMSRDLEEIKGSMVTRSEWESRQDATDETLKTILNALPNRQQGRYYGSSSGSGEHQGTKPSTPR